MSCNPLGGQLFGLPGQKHSLSGVLTDGGSKTVSVGVYRSTLIPVFSVGPLYLSGNIRQRSLSQTLMTSSPDKSRGGKNDPEI